MIIRDDRNDLGSDTDGARRLLPPRSGSDSQAAGHYRNRPETRHLGVSCPERNSLGGPSTRFFKKHDLTTVAHSHGNPTIRCDLDEVLAEGQPEHAFEDPVFMRPLEPG